MFEDSTFESTGRIRTRSRAWMIAALAFNSSILLAMVLIPLIDPQALPHQPSPILMVVPSLEQPVRQSPPKQTAPATTTKSEMDGSRILAPSQIPDRIFRPDAPEPPFIVANAAWDPNSAAPSGPGSPFGSRPGPRVVHPDANASVRVSSMIEAGLLVQKTPPIYPPIPRAMRMQGTVVLAATISKNGTIENLRVTSGPEGLQQAAVDAVRTWRYRPYLLDGQPVEVETTINVIFTLDRQ